jgi:hypothetical protein
MDIHSNNYINAPVVRRVARSIAANLLVSVIVPLAVAHHELHPDDRWRMSPAHAS